MICELCGQSCRLYGSWHTPPEDFYYWCLHCNRKWYPHDITHKEQK